MEMSFVLLFAAWEAALTALRVLFRKKEIKPSLRAVITAAKYIAAIAFAVLVLAGPVVLRPAQPLLFAGYAALLADAVVDSVYAVFCKVSKKEKKFSIKLAAALCFGILFFVYGFVNMETVRPAYHTYSSPKLTSEHKFVFVADMHTGSAQPFSVTEKTVRDIKAQNPDFVILGGDITDDYTTKDEMQYTFALFADFDVPVYYVFGNHDRQGHAEYANGRQYTAEELEREITLNGITVLKDEYVTISPDLLLLGREDITEGDGRKKADALPNPEPSAFLVVADHQPVEAEENLATGMDLQVSGHTHAGQLLPLKPLYALIGFVHGDYNVGSAVLNVSSGACGWRVPMRTQAHCNYEVITLKPAQ